ncbi:hypothetical protein COLO4_19811 [Corchorus olitorius]|uniref:Uncharacterized protein n=1 Tax=Corchorus olitorius TaxID=93759 RepID=A0A1R3J392_9ROSI|nr:hypothetical protein COLO4_19811 [Corchorus olitorius]
MKILNFSAASASNAEFIYTYVEICFEHSPYFVEIRLTESRSQSMNFTASTSLESIGYFGSSWFLWNTSRINFYALSQELKLITFKISFKS